MIKFLLNDHEISIDGNLYFAKQVTLMKDGSYVATLVPMVAKAQTCWDEDEDGDEPSSAPASWS